MFTEIGLEVRRENRVARYATLCSAMICCPVLWGVVLSSVVQCCDTLCYVVQGERDESHLVDEFVILCG